MASVGAAQIPLADDSAAARQAALARLRAAAPRQVCADTSRMSRTHGTTCASREFAAPPILTEPKIVWTVKPGWWGVWSPFLAGDRMLAGSCNNDDNRGLSAFDTKTGKTLWRIGDVCGVGNRAGSMGNVAFHELPSGEVLWIYPRENGEPADYYVVDVKAGRIVRSLKPVKRGPTRSHGAVLTALTQSEKDQTSYINGLNPAMDQILWRNESFRSSCKDKLDPHCRPVFSPPAAHGSILFQTATAKEQPDPPTRQLHAIDLRTGKPLWRHTAQPAVEQTRRGATTLAYRSDDGTPMVAGGKVIIQVDTAKSTSLRALDPNTGAVVWNTAPIATELTEAWGGGKRRFLGNRVGVGEMLVTEIQTNGAKEFWGYRLADGTIAWRRPVPVKALLLASAGGVFYVSERVGKEDFQLQGIDGLTGTLLWTTVIPGHNLPFDQQWDIQDTRPSGLQGPSWRIGPDGAIYGVSLQGVYKLQ